MFGNLLQDAVGIGVRAVNLVDGHNDWHFGGLGVVDGLDGLRHNTVVRGDNQDHNVSDLGASSTH